VSTPARKRLGVYWAAACGGCDIAVLELHEKLLELLEHVEIAFWPCVADVKYADLEAMPDGNLDLCLFNGAIRNEENLKMATLLRRKSRCLVAFGACASSGGVVGLGDLCSASSLIDRAFTTESTANPAGVRPSTGPGHEGLPALVERTRQLAAVVPVDYSVAGCPPEAHQVGAVLEAFLAGQLPEAGSVIGAGDRSLCSECKLPRREIRVPAFRRRHQADAAPDACLLEQGFVCLGPATRSGCGARCPSIGVPCRGCYGPAPGVEDVGAKMIGLLGSVLEDTSPEELQRALAEVLDPVGTFYRYTLATSRLGPPRRSDEEGGA